MHDYLLTFAFFWMVMAAVLGLRLGIRSLGFGAEVEALAVRNDLAAYHSLTKGFNWAKTVHAHTFLFSVVGVAIAFALPQTAYGSGVKSVIAAFVMVGSVGWTLGASKEIRPVMGLSDFVFLFAILFTAYGLLAAHIPTLLPQL